MNLLLAKAELAVRGCRWGEGLGGVEASDECFIDLVNTRSFLERVNTSARENVEVRRGIVARFQVTR